MREKINILQLVNGEFYGGAEKIQEMLLMHLNPRVFNPYCVSLMNGEFVREAKGKELPITVIPMRNKFDITVVFKVAEFIKEHQITLIHSHTVRTNLVGRLVKATTRVPLITHVHSPPLFDTNNPIKNKFNHLIDKLGQRWTTRFICVSHSLKNYLASRGVSSERIEVIPNGVELARFQYTASKEEARKRLGLDSHHRFIAMIALFRPRKGTECLIKAVHHLVVSNKVNVYCLLVGNFRCKGYKNKILELIRQLDLEDRVILLGFRNDIKQILAAVDAIVLPSLFGEGLPMVLLEAMAMAKPVVASEDGGIPQVIKDGETGILTPPGDYLKLGEGIQKILQDPGLGSQLGSNAQSLIRKGYSAQVIVNKIEEIYMELVEETDFTLS